MTDTNMFVSTLPDIPRIITAVAEWLACLVCVLPLQKRKRGLPFVGLCVAFFVIQSLYMMLTDRFDGILWNLCMAGAESCSGECGASEKRGEYPPAEAGDKSCADR